ncbi:hypothetical protein PDESU_01806 [Pontiella desulfatans]|uniref:Endonuclease/exonuclease/phosphatase domain-containing protein n=1 Tax=Pontiella desulfatans TaxID=2750659 RepID=A0A6C2TZX6_PONDE|nr:endonuclease/exonuclease/phosphatase family protein [Pontiella desulfatans]VGO13250.1 hypothetical protein PDESU_01806 [Pontiella desulfatans]
MKKVTLSLFVLWAAGLFPAAWADSNVVVRVMAANTTSGNYQRYESPGLNIFKGLRPDIVAVQEFNYAGSYRDMVDDAFGEEFDYFRESESGYDIPNGIISRYPILESGSWDDSNMSNRGFAWARIDVPGTNDLYVVSVHFKASSSDAARRGLEASQLKSLIQANFPGHAWIVLAGDFNIYSETEAAVTTLESFLSDSPVPADKNGDTGTNSSRSRRYDRIYFSPSMAHTQVPVEMPSRTYANGLVFDSRIHTPLSEVYPVAAGDSGAVNMQHMAVVRDFALPLPSVEPPLQAVLGHPVYSAGEFQCALTGSTGQPYVVQSSTNLTESEWVPVQTNFAPFTFTEPDTSESSQRFYRALALP